MAFPVVESTNTGSGNPAALSYSAPLPSGISAGDLLLVFVGLHASASAPDVDTPSGWTRFFTSGGALNLRRFSGFYKVATGSEGSSLSFTTTSNARKASVSYRISGYTGTPEANVAQGESGNPDPPSLSPSWGAADTLWLAVTAAIRGTSATISGPSGFTNLIQVAEINNGQDVPRVASAQLENATATLDPGTFSPDYTWAAATIAVQGTAAGAARQMMHYRRLRI